MMRQAILLTLVALSIGLLALPQSVAVAQKSPEKIELNPNDRKGVLLVKVDKDIARLDLQMHKKGKTGFGSRVYVIPGKKYGEGEYYIGRTLSPHIYQVTSIWQQKHFGIMFEPGPIEVEIKSGTVTYLGKINSGELLKVLRSEASRTGNTSATPGNGFLSNSGKGVVKLSERDPVGFAEARDYAIETMKISEAQFELAAVDSKFTLED